MPAGSYLMTSSFAYRKLEKLPASHHHEHADDQQQQQPTPPSSATSIIQDYYHSYYRALVARKRLSAAPWRRMRTRRQGTPPAATTPTTTTTTTWGRRRRRRLRISSLARALRRKAAAVGGSVRASVAKVAARLREGRPYIGYLFAGNYVFMQVAPSSPATVDKGVVPFTEYYYGKVRSSRTPPQPLQLHPAPAATAI